MNGLSSTNPSFSGGEKTSLKLCGLFVIAESAPMKSMLHFDQTTLANMTAALEYVCRKLPPKQDTPAVRKHIAAEISAAADKRQTSVSDLTTVGLKVVNDSVFPPSRSWLKALLGQGR